MTDNKCNSSAVAHSEESTPDLREVNKRRSVVFHRRSLAPQFDEVLDNNEKFEESAIGESSEEPFNLKEYIDSLKNERKMWIETLKERKRQTRNLSKQRANLQDCKEDLDLNVLSDSERSFLLNRPNYEHICKNATRLSKVAVKLVTLNQHVTKLNQRFISKAEERINELKKKTIEMVD